MILLWLLWFSVTVHAALYRSWVFSDNATRSGGTLDGRVSTTSASATFRDFRTTPTGAAMRLAFTQTGASAFSPATAVFPLPAPVAGNASATLFFVSCLVEIDTDRPTRQGVFIAENGASEWGANNGQDLGASYYILNPNPQWWAVSQGAAGKWSSSPSRPADENGPLLVVLKVQSTNGGLSAKLSIRVFSEDENRAESAFSSSSVSVETANGSGRFERMRKLVLMGATMDFFECRVASEYNDVAFSFTPAPTPVPTPAPTPAATLPPTMMPTAPTAAQTTTTNDEQTAAATTTTTTTTATTTATAVMSSTQSVPATIASALAMVDAGLIGGAVGGAFAAGSLIVLIMALICRAKRSSSSSGDSDARPVAASSEYAGSVALFRVQSDAPAYDQLPARESHYANSAANFQIADEPTYASL